MKTIDVDASQWRTPLDFYDALLAALDAPDWQGRSVDALIDSIIIGSINGVEPPYRVVVKGLDQASAPAVQELRDAFDALGAKTEITPVSATLEVVETQTGL